MNKTLGISVYLKDMDEEYVAFASKNNAKYIFTSLHIPEEDLSKAEENIKTLLLYCKKYDMSLVPDVSPVTFEKLNLEMGDFASLYGLGIRCLRLDYGFDDIDQLVNLQSKFQLMLNASTITEDYLTRCKLGGVDLNKIIVVHNFYPKTDTALSVEYFKKLNKLFIDYKLNVFAFVPGDKLKRFPLYEGLPTIEKHRDVNPYAAAIELFNELDISGVMIGDSMANNETIRYVSNYISNNEITIPVYLNKENEYLYDTDLKSRRDCAQSVVRLNTDRTTNIRPCNNGPRKCGGILLINELGGRYCGEIQICKESLNFSPDANNVGYVDPRYIELLDFIPGGANIRFAKIEK